MSSGWYHQFKDFMHVPKEGETLRQFVEIECWRRAVQIQESIENRPEKERFLSHPSYELVKAMPVNLAITVSNYSVKKHGTNAPPIVADRMGCKIFCDDEYSFYGEFGNFLVHISETQYPWIGELEYPHWEIYGPDLIVYDNYDYQLDGLEDDEEEDP